MEVQDIFNKSEIPNRAITRSKANELAKAVEDLLRKPQDKENEQGDGAENQEVVAAACDDAEKQEVVVAACDDACYKG
ncbi:unnamed protein product [Cochlearia groenlandica]